MDIKRLLRKTTLALLGLTLVAPISAEAATVKLRPEGSSRLLTLNPTIGFTTLQSQSSAIADQQRWEEIDGPGPTVYYRNVANKRCLRAAPLNNTFTRTVTCNFSDDAASRQQQWIFSNGQLANRDRLINNNPANSLTADFSNINRVVGMDVFTNAGDQRWVKFPG